MPSKPPQSKAQKKAHKTARKLSGHASKKLKKKRISEAEEDAAWEMVMKKQKKENDSDRELLSISIPSIEVNNVERGGRKKGQTRRKLKAALHDRVIL